VIERPWVNTENSSFFLAISEIKSLQEKLQTKKLIINGANIEHPNFLIDHDIFHHFVDSMLFHEEHKKQTGFKLEKEVSTSFHGEALIEIFSRFFGNLETETHKEYGLGGVIIGEYVKMKKVQTGAKPNQPFRVFPIRVSCTHRATGKFSTYEFEYQKAIEATKRYTIIGSLVSGEILTMFLQFYQKLLGNSKFASSQYYTSIEFKLVVQSYITNPNKNKMPILQLLDTFLISTYDSSLEKVLGCVDSYVEAFYRVFLNNPYDCVDFGDEYLYFSIRKSQYEYNLLGHILY
jgi:hypothetical protein